MRITRIILLAWFACACPIPAPAGILNSALIVTGTPEGSWAYSELTNAGHGQSVSYFATTRPEFDAAIFQDFVTYDPNIGFGWTGFGFDTIQVFSTFVVSETDQTIRVHFGGDDGHSLFIDEQFVDGGGFGASIVHDLLIEANVPRKIELVGYNGPGNWVFGFGLRDPNRDDIAAPIESAPGIQLNAEGSFAPVPEPSTLLLFLSAAPFALTAWRRRRSADSRQRAERNPNRRMS